MHRLTSTCKQSLLSPKVSPVGIIESDPSFEQKVLCFLLTRFADQEVYEASQSAASQDSALGSVPRQFGATSALQVWQLDSVALIRTFWKTVTIFAPPACG